MPTKAILPVRYAMPDVHFVSRVGPENQIFSVPFLHCACLLLFFSTARWAHPTRRFSFSNRSLSSLFDPLLQDLTARWPNMQMYWNVSTALLFFGQSHKMSCSHERGSITCLFLSVSAVEHHHHWLFPSAIALKHILHPTFAVSVFLWSINNFVTTLACC